MTTDEALELALTAFDGPYLAAEAELLRDPAAAAARLAARNEADPVATTLRAALGAAAETLAAYAILDPLLDAQEENVRPTPMRVPVPESVAAALYRRYGAALAPLLAWRLVKQPSMAVWRAVAFLRYCESARHAAAMPALARYVSTLADAFLLEETTATLRRMGGTIEALIAEARFRR